MENRDELSGIYKSTTGMKSRGYLDLAFSRFIEEQGHLSQGTFSIELPLALEEDFSRHLSALPSNLKVQSQPPQEGKAIFQATYSPRSIESSVSVVVPCFNPSEPHLKALLRQISDSLKGVGSKKHEVIFIDDCSPSQPAWLNEEFAQAHQELEVRVVRQSVNSGVSASRNKGIELASNDFIVFIDHDDQIDPHHLPMILGELESGAEIVATGMRFPDGHIFCAHLSPNLGFLIENGFGSGIGLNRQGPVIQEILQKEPLYSSLNPLHYEDWEINAVAYFLGAKISVLPLPSYFYNLLPSGRDSQHKLLQVRSRQELPLHVFCRLSRIRPQLANQQMLTFLRYLIDDNCRVTERLAQVQGQLNLIKADHSFMELEAMVQFSRLPRSRKIIKLFDHLLLSLPVIGSIHSLITRRIFIYIDKLRLGIKGYV